MAESFTCDNCGKDFPQSDLKEAKIGDSEKMLSLCPTCLDEKMNASDEVYGIEGDEKRRAALLTTEESDEPSEPVTGQRQT